MTEPEHVILVDLDNTLCDTRHREHLIPKRRAPGAFDEYCMACKDDPPIEWVCNIVRHLQGGTAVLILSGREECARTLTALWLHRHGIWPVSIILRQPGDDRPNPAIKAAVIDDLLKAGIEIDFILDDHPAVLAAGSDRGIPGLLVCTPTSPHFNINQLMKIKDKPLSELREVRL